MDDLASRVAGLEGYSSQPYWDNKQWSVGYGTRASGPNDVVDRAGAVARLNAELGKARGYVENFAPNLPPGAKDALTSLTYNAGPGWQQSGLGKAVQSGNLDQAQQLFASYNHAGGQVNPGLTSRRQQELGWWNGSSPSSATSYADPDSTQASSPAQTAITKAMAGNDDNSQLPVGARPAMFQGQTQSPQGGNLFTMADMMGNIGALGRGMVTAANPAAGAALQAAAANQQLAQAPDLKQVSTDMFGHPVMAWVDKMRHTITPASMGGAAGGGGAGGAADPSGATGTGMGGMGSNINENTLRQFQQMQGSPEDKLAALQKMSPAAYSVVQGLRNGSESINLLPRQGEGRAGWIALAQAVDPNFKGQSDYEQRVTQAKAETSSGVFGKNDKSADQLMGHLDQLDKKIDDAHLSKFPIVNKVGNYVSQQLGNEQAQSALGALHAAAEAPAQELVSLMRNGGGAESDIKAWRSMFDAADSPAAMKAALRQGVNTMHSIIGANVNQHNRIFHENKTVNDYLSKDSQAIINRLQGGDAPKAAAPAGASEGATATGPNGHQIVLKGGQWLDAQTGQPLPQ